MAEERGIQLSPTKRTGARDYTDLVRVTLRCGQDTLRVAPSAALRGLGSTFSTSSSRITSRCSATATSA